MNNFLNLYRSVNTLLGRNIFTLALLVVIVLSFSGESRAESLYNDFDSLEKSDSFDIDYSEAKNSLQSLSSFNFAPTALAVADNIKIIKKASLKLEVLDIEEARNEINRIIKEYDGYIESLDSNEYREGAVYYSFGLRIPRGQNFENFLEEIGALGDKKRYDHKIVDITQEYSDAFAKIKNLETSRDRLQKLLELKTKSLDDVLSIDRELSRVQVEIDKLTGIQSERDNHMKFSIAGLTISLKQEPMEIDLESIKDYDSPEKKESLEDSPKVGSDSFLDIINQNIVIIIIAIVFVAVFWIRRKFPKKK
jgi:tetratricopeptide (TPR) repeat protein